MGLEAILVYRGADGRAVTLGAVRDLDTVRHVRDELVKDLQVRAGIWNEFDPVLSALKSLEIERIDRVLALVESEDTADGADVPLADSIPPSAPRPTRSGRRSLRAVQDDPAKGDRD